MVKSIDTGLERLENLYPIEKLEKRKAEAFDKIAKLFYGCYG